MADVIPGKGLEATVDSRSVPQTLRCHGREAQAWRDLALCCPDEDGQAHTAGSSRTGGDPVTQGPGSRKGAHRHRTD